MKPLRRSILLTGSLFLLLIPKQLVNACGFMVAPGEYRFWLLQPDLTNELELSPFFFASTYLYRGGENAWTQPYPQRNIEEWGDEVRMPGGHAGRAVGLEDIDQLLNKTAPRVFFAKTDSLARANGFMRYLLRKENSETYHYMQLSKKVEEIAANPDPWDEGPVQKANVSRLIAEAQSLYHTAPSPFIKMRTAFQLMRLYGFNGEAASLCRVYDDRIGPVASNSWIKSAALYLKATRGGVADADRLLAQVFDRGDYNRSYCLIRLRSVRVDSLASVSKDAHERTVLRAMKVFNYPGRSLPAIQKIYASEPGYREIPFLLLREINKTEDWLLTNRVTGFKPAVYNASYEWVWSDSWDRYNKANRVADEAYAGALNDFLLRLIREKKSAQPALLHLYSAHLSMLLGNYPTAGEQLQAAAAYGPQLPANVRTQIAVNRFLLSLEMQKNLDASSEETLLDLLREPASRSGVYDADIMKDQLILYTARKMIAYGHKARGLLLLSRTRRALGELPISAYKDVYEEIAETAEPADYDSIIAVIGNRNKSDFEKFVTRGRFGSPNHYYDWSKDYATDDLYWNRNRLLDGKASWYLRHDNLPAALTALRRIPDSFWRKAPYSDFISGNPFLVDIYRHETSDGAYPTKGAIVARMLELQAQAARWPSKRAGSHFQLANAWYNMTWFGNSWLMVKPWWSMWEMTRYGEAVKKTAFNDDYYGCGRARELYLLAMRETRDKKLAALCCFMAGQCDHHRQEYAWRVRHSGQRDTEPLNGFDPLKNPYLSDLRQKGDAESSYREMVKECAVYADYIRTFDRVL